MIIYLNNLTWKIIYRLIIYHDRLKELKIIGVYQKYLIFSSCCHCGAGKGQLKTLKVLAKNGANLWLKNHRGDLPLHEAVHSGRKDLVRWFLTQKPDAADASNNDGRCPLHIAAINNHVEMCKVKFHLVQICFNNYRYNAMPIFNHTSMCKFPYI